MAAAAAPSASASIEVQVNGQARKLPAGATIAALLEAMDLGRQRCAVEVNQVLIRRDKHAKHALNAGDRIEVVTLVGGG